MTARPHALQAIHSKISTHCYGPVKKLTGRYSMVRYGHVCKVSFSCYVCTRGHTYLCAPVYTCPYAHIRYNCAIDCS